MMSKSSAVFLKASELPAAQVHALCIIKSEESLITLLSPAQNTTEAAEQANPSQIVVTFLFSDFNVL